MRGRSRRPFTVEVKSIERRHGTSIPSRLTPAPPPTPHLFRGRPAGPPASAAEPRRILPSLIAAESEAVEPEVTPPAAIDPPPEARRKPRKIKDTVKPTTITLAAELDLPVPAPDVGEQGSPTRATREHRARPGAPLAPGERWKRRLGRWSR